jgi:hypothetical protein
MPRLDMEFLAMLLAGFHWKIHPMAGHEISDNATFNAFGPVPGYNTHLINGSSMMAEINCLLRV